MKIKSEDSIYHNCWGGRLWLVYNKSDVIGGQVKMILH